MNQQSFTQNRWFRLATSIGIALSLALTLLLLPLIAGSMIQTPSTALPEQSASLSATGSNWSVEEAVQVALPFGVETTYAATATAGGFVVAKYVVTGNQVSVTPAITEVRQGNPIDSYLGSPTNEVADYRIVIKNNTGSAIAAPITVTDVVPDGMVCVKSQNQPAGAPAQVEWAHNESSCINNRVATFWMPPGGPGLAAGAVVTLGYSVRPYANNAVIVTNDEVNLIYNGNTYLASGLNVTVSVKAPQLAMTKTVATTDTTASDSTSHGGTVTYTLNLYNSGSYTMYWSSANVITIQDTYPQALALAAPVVYSIPFGTSMVEGPANGMYTMTWVITTNQASDPNGLNANGLVPGSAYTGTPTFTVKFNGTGLPSGYVYQNVAKAWGGENTPTPAYATATLFYFAQPSQLTVTKMAPPVNAPTGTVFAGDMLYYTVTFTSGVASLANLVITEDFSAITPSATFVGLNYAPTLPFTYSYMSGSYYRVSSVSPYTLAANSVATVALKFQLNQYMTPGIYLTNTIWVGRVASDVYRISSNGYMSTGGSITAPAVISANNNIEYIKTVEPAPAYVGGMSVVSPGNFVTYTIILTQLGNNGYARVHLLDTLGDGITFTGMPIYNGSNPAYKGQYLPDGMGNLKFFEVTIDITPGTTNRNDRAWQLIARTTSTNYNSIPNPVLNTMILDYEKDITTGVELFNNLTQKEKQNPVLLGAGQVTMSKTILWPSQNGASDGDVVIMDIITYQYQITNMGSISLYNLVLTDNLIGNVTITPNLVLTAGSSIVLTAGYTVQGAHAVGRNITNTATFTGAYPSFIGAVNGITVATATVRATFLITSKPDITVSKEVTWVNKGTYTPTVGDWLTYTYRITSLYAGNVRYGNLQDNRLSPINALRGYHDAAYGSNLVGGNQYTLSPLSSTVFSMVVKVTEKMVADGINDAGGAANIGSLITYTNIFTVADAQYFDVGTSSWSNVTSGQPSITATAYLTYTAGYSFEKQVQLLDTSGNVITTNFPDDHGVASNGWTYFTPTVNSRIRYLLWVTNTGGITLEADAGAITDVFWSMGTAGIFTNNTKITVPPGKNGVVAITSELRNLPAYNDNLGDLTLKQNYVLSGVIAGPSWDPASPYHFTSALTNTITPTFKVITNSTVNSLLPFLEAKAKIFSPSLVVISDTLSAVRNSITLPITFTAGITVYKYAVAATDTTKVITEAYLNDKYAYVFRVANTGTMPIVISLTDIYSATTGDQMTTTFNLVPVFPMAVIDPMTYREFISNVNVTAQLFNNAVQPAFTTSSLIKVLTNSPVITAWVYTSGGTTPVLTTTVMSWGNQVTVLLKLKGGLLQIQKTPYLSRPGVFSDWKQVLTTGLTADGFAATLGDYITYEYKIINDSLNAVTGTAMYDTDARNPNLNDIVINLVDPNLSTCIGSTDNFTIAAKAIGATAPITCTLKSDPRQIVDASLRGAIQEFEGCHLTKAGLCPTPYKLGAVNKLTTPVLISFSNYVSVTGNFTSTVPGVAPSFADGSTLATVRLIYTNTIQFRKWAASAADVTSTMEIEAKVGQPVTYYYQITNTGNLAQQQVEIQDASDVNVFPDYVQGDQLIFLTAALPPCYTQPCPSITLTQVFTPNENQEAYVKKFLNGLLTNTAMVVATPTVVAAETVKSIGVITPQTAIATATIVLSSPGGIDVKKTAEWGTPGQPAKVMTDPAKIGDVVTYTYVVTNTGDLDFEAKYNVGGGLPIRVIDTPEGEILFDVAQFGGNVVNLVLSAKKAVTQVITATVDQDFIKRARLINSMAQVTNSVVATGYVAPALVGSTAIVPGYVPTATVPVTYEMYVDVFKTAITATDPVTVGERVTYTYEISNDGDVDVTVMLTDTFPNNSILVYGPITVPAGMTHTHVTTPVIVPAYFPVQTDTTNVQVITNTVLAMADDGMGNLGRGNYTATDWASIRALLNFAVDITKTAVISKAAGNTKVGFAEVGDQIAYTFNYTNIGGSEVTFDLADRFLNGARGSVPVASNVVLGAGASGSQTFNITFGDGDIPAGLPLELRNVADLLVKKVGTVTLTNVSTKTSGMVAVPITFTINLQVIKGVDLSGLVNGKAQVGKPITYTYRVMNVGKVTVDEIVVTDDPLGLIGNSQAKLKPPTAGEPESQIVFIRVYTPTLADLQRVNQTLVNTGTAVATRSVVTGNFQSNVFNVVIGVDSALVVTKTSVVTAMAGDTVIYNFQVKNNGTLTLTAVTFNDPMVGGAVGPTIDQLAPGATQAFSASHVIPAATPTGPHTNTVTARATILANPLLGQAVSSSTWVIQVTQPPTTAVSLRMEKMANPASGTSVMSGTNIVYTIKVTNTGGAMAVGVQITDTLPAGLALVSANPAGTNGVYNIGNLAPNATSMVMITTTVVTDGGTIVNSATAKDAGTATAGPVQTTHIVTKVITTPPILSMAKTSVAVNKAALNVGDMITYTIKVTNSGTVVAQNVVITDALPSTVDLVSVKATGTDSIVTGSNKITVTINALEPTKVAEIVVVVKVNDTAIGQTSIVNTASAQATDPNNPTVPVLSNGVDTIVINIKKRIYLPIIQRQPAVVVTPANLQSSVDGAGKVTVTNVGDTAITADAFWVDLYIFKTAPSDAVKNAVKLEGGRWEKWQTSGVTQGVAWQITAADLQAAAGKRELSKGESITLVMKPRGDATIPAGSVGYDPEQTSKPVPTLTSGMVLISYADSYAGTTSSSPYLVQESNETDNASETVVP